MRPRVLLVESDVERGRAGMGCCGVGSIEELRPKTRFVRISPAGMRESHPQDMTITREAPNCGRPGRR